MGGDWQIISEAVKKKKRKEKKSSLVGQLALVTTSDSAGFPGYQTKTLIRKKGLYEL